MALDDDVALLERIPVLEVLGRDALRILAIGAESRRLRQGEALFREGEDADAAYVVVSGRIALRNQASGGQIALSVGPGALIGESALLTSVPRAASAGATEDTLLLRIPRHTFLRTLEGYPDAASALRNLLARRVQQTVQELEDVRRRLENLDEPHEEP
jgi:CRP-like cAMP-binding protein